MSRYRMIGSDGPYKGNPDRYMIRDTEYGQRRVSDILSCHAIIGSMDTKLCKPVSQETNNLTV